MNARLLAGDRGSTGGFEDARGMDDPGMAGDGSVPLVVVGSGTYIVVELGLARGGAKLVLKRSVSVDTTAKPT